MSPGKIRSVLVAFTFVFAASSVSAQYDYSHRKSTAKFNVKKPNATIKAEQIRNHFGFGGAMNWYLHDTIAADPGCKQSYGEAFLKYFEFCTPENEMKWDYVYQDSDEKLDQIWWKADTILNFCERNDIKVRGHNLFWNEDTCWIPPWAWALPTKDLFKEAMKERIDTAMNYGLGRVVHWDIINEIIHGYSSPGVGGAKPAYSDLTLVKYSGDPNIFDWILTEARKIDKTSKFTINDYGLEGSSGDCDLYIERCKPFKDKFDIIGMEGHFDNYPNNCSRDNLNARVKQLVDGLGREVWFTEVDWKFDIRQSPNKIEELMRTAFSNKNVGGIVMWTWVKRHMWRGDLTCYFVDSLMEETETGKRWRDVRSEWRTNTSGTSDDEGNFTLTGYQGKYRIVMDEDTAIVYLHPGDSLEIIKDFPDPNAIRPVSKAKSDPILIRLNGSSIKLNVTPDGSGPMYLSTYSISGKLISRIPLNIVNGAATISKLPSGCHVFRISTANKQLYTGMGVYFK